MFEPGIGGAGGWVRTEDRLVGGWLLTVTEDLLGAGAGRLRQRLLYSPAGSPCLVLDLTAVDWVDSTGMGVLISAVKRLQACSGQLRWPPPATSPGCCTPLVWTRGCCCTRTSPARWSCETAPAEEDQLS